MKSLLRRVTWPGCVYFGNLGALFTNFFDERFVGAGIVVTAPRQGGELKGFIHSPDKQTGAHRRQAVGASAKRRPAAGLA